MFKQICFLIVTVILISSVFGLSDFDILVEGEASDSMYHGQSYSFAMNCADSATVGMALIPDFNGNGIIDIYEFSVVPPDVAVTDNAEPSDDGPPFFDGDSELGSIRIDMIIQMDNVDWIIQFYNETDTLTRTLKVIAPDDYEYSLNGTVHIPEITPPDARLTYGFVLAGVMEPPLFSLALIDSMGYYDMIWPGDEAYIFVQAMLSDGEIDSFVYMDGHIEDFDLHFPEPDTSSEGLSDLYFLIEDEPGFSQIQGQMYSANVTCTPNDTVMMDIIQDANLNSEIDVDEFSVVGETYVIDNGEVSPGDILYDSNPEEGVLSVQMIISLDPGMWFFRFTDETSEIYEILEVTVPDPLMHSLSGRVEIEDIVAPADELEYIGILMGTFSPVPMLMYTFTNEMGEFELNWPGEAGDLQIMVVGEYEYDTTAHVDGFVTDYIIRLGGAPPEEFIELGYASDPAEEPVPAEDILVNYYDIYEEEIFESFFLPSDDYITIPVYDIGSDYWIFFSGADSVIDESICISPAMPIEITDEMDYPGYVDVYANHANVELEVVIDGYSPDLLPPEGLAIYATSSDMSGSHTYAEELIFMEGEYEGEAAVVAHANICDGYWGFELPLMLPGDIMVEDVDTGFTVTNDDAGETITIVMSVLDYTIIDSMTINFDYDHAPERWEIRQEEIKAVYINRETGEELTQVYFPYEGPIVLPIFDLETGIVFKGTYTEFADHNFLSPAETLWISPEDYPDDYDLYADHTNYHFVIIFDGFDLDSVPESGLDIDLFGENSEVSATYYAKHTVFIDMYREEYFVGGERELCDAEWTCIIPDTLAGIYIPEFTDTTFDIPEVDEWPWYELHVPVRHVREAIDESVKPSSKALVQAYPNPFNSSVNIIVEHSGGQILAEIYDVFGKKVHTLLNDTSSKGEIKLKWNPDCNIIPSGVYMLRVNTDTGDITERILFIQ